MKRWLFLVFFLLQQLHGLLGQTRLKGMFSIVGPQESYDHIVFNEDTFYRGNGGDMGNCFGVGTYRYLVNDSLLILTYGMCPRQEIKKIKYTYDSNSNTHKIVIHLLGPYTSSPSSGISIYLKGSKKMDTTNQSGMVSFDISHNNFDTIQIMEAGVSRLNFPIQFNNTNYLEMTVDITERFFYQEYKIDTFYVGIAKHNIIELIPKSEKGKGYYPYLDNKAYKTYNRKSHKAKWRYMHHLLSNSNKN